MNVLPENIRLDAEAAVSSLLPVKSKHMYEKEHDLFMQWKTENSLEGSTEEILLAYFVQKVNYLYHVISILSYVWSFIGTKIQVVKSLGALLNAESCAQCT